MTPGCCYYCGADTPRHQRDAHGRVYCFGRNCDCVRARELRGEVPELPRPVWRIVPRVPVGVRT